MAENNTVKSKRDTHVERMRKKYPDKKFEDDEEIFGAVSDDYDQYEQELGEMRGREKTLSDMFAADPRSAQFLADMHNGKDPVMGLMSMFGDELKDALDDPSRQEDLGEARKEYLDRVSKGKEYDAQYEKNMDTTLETLRSFQSERGLSDEQVDGVIDFILKIINDGVMGKFTPETLDLALKALNYDTDVSNATEEGQVAGRNAKITEQLRKADKGDGNAPLGGKNGSPTGGRTKAPSMFDLANEAM